MTPTRHLNLFEAASVSRATVSKFPMLSPHTHSQQHPNKNKARIRVWVKGGWNVEGGRGILIFDWQTEDKEMMAI